MALNKRIAMCQGALEKYTSDELIAHLVDTNMMTNNRKLSRLIKNAGFKQQVSLDILITITAQHRPGSDSTAAEL